VFLYLVRNLNTGENGMNRTLEILDKALDKRVIIKLKYNKEFRGILKGFDQHLNLILDKTEEVINFEDQTIKNLGKIILRGDSVVMISPPSA